MTDVIGVDTDWLVQLVFAQHSSHDDAKRFWDNQIASGIQIGIAPQVLAELVHLISDGKRFESPCSMIDAISFAARWWRADGVVQLFPTNDSAQLAWDWMKQYQLGRKRVLDTQLAATFHVHGISRNLTLNARDFTVFGVFEIVDFMNSHSPKD